MAPTPVETEPFGFELSGAQSYELYSTGEVDFLDARGADIFMAGHIADAFSVPYDVAGQRVLSLVAEGWISPDRRVVVYCIGGEECDESKFVARALFEAGFDPSMVHIDMAGYSECESAVYPTDTCSDMSVLSP